MVGIIETTQQGLSNIDSLEEAYNSWVKFISSAKEKSALTYTKAVKRFMQYKAENGITAINRDIILNYRQSLKDSGRKASTIQLYITALKLFFQWLKAEHIIAEDITEHIEGAKVSREFKKDHLTSEQVKHILALQERETVKGKRDYAILLLLFTCGLRTIEASRANVNDMQVKGNTTVLYIQGKGKEDKGDFVTVPPITEQAIREYLTARKATAEEPLFTATANRCNGQRLTTCTYSKLCKKAFRKAGIDSERVTAHSTRHTAVTLALLNGGTLQEVQQFARHNNIATTQIYAHNLDKLNNQCSNCIAELIS